MSTVLLKDLKKVYEGNVVAVHDVNLEIADKEFIVLVGPSGCGKSTTLRMVAGLEDISDGELYIDGRLCNDVAPKDRDIAMVFQSYALYPHLSVYDNMAFALKLKKTPKAVIDFQDAVGDVLQAGDHPQGGGFPAAGGADEDHELLVLDIQVEVMDRDHVVIVYFLDFRQFHTCHYVSAPF